MTRISFILTFFTIYLTNAQVKELSESELQEKADTEILEYSERIYDADSTKLREKAYESYSLLVKQYSKSEKRSFYLYTKGCLAFDDEESKKCFKEVIQINDWQYYVRQSYLKLSWIAVRDKDFNTALKYLDLIEKLEKQKFTCGNEMESYYAQLKNIREQSETGLKK
jgi:hypothetical protein